jgi:hypothetical protein
MAVSALCALILELWIVKRITRNADTTDGCARFETKCPKFRNVQPVTWAYDRTSISPQILQRQ